MSRSVKCPGKVPLPRDCRSALHARSRSLPAVRALGHRTGCNARIVWALVPNPSELGRIGPTRAAPRPPPMSWYLALQCALRVPQRVPAAVLRRQKSQVRILPGAFREPALRAGFRVLRVVLQGHGRSGMGSERGAYWCPFTSAESRSSPGRRAPVQLGSDREDVVYQVMRSLEGAHLGPVAASERGPGALRSAEIRPAWNHEWGHGAAPDLFGRPRGRRV